MKIPNHHHSQRLALQRLALALAAGAGLGLASTHAAINVTATGSAVQTFNTRPAATDWATLTWTGTSADIVDTAGMDAAVQALTADGTTTQVGTSGTNPPSADVLPRQNSSLFVLQSRPTSAVKGCVMMAKLQNTSGGGIDNLEITCDFFRSAPVPTPITGLRAYYSLTGLADSWTVIPELCTSTPGALKTVVTLTATWADATPMYVVWVDDNSAAPGASDTWTMIDNVSFGKAGTGARITAFDFGLPAYGAATIAGTDISIGVPTGTPVSALSPTFTLSDGATCDLVSGSTQDFSAAAVTYTVTPLAGDPVPYTVSVTQKAVVDVAGTYTNNPGTTIGTTNIANMTAYTSFDFWGGFTCPIPMITNGFNFRIDSGGGNTVNYTGYITGAGGFEVKAYSLTNSTRIGGNVGNTYTGATTITSGRVDLQKTFGNALCGNVTLNGSSKLQWNVSEQIDDSSNVTLTSTASLDLNGLTETINELYLVTGNSVQTGAGGVLKVAKLFLNGVEQAEVAKIAGDGFVLGSGYIEVGASGPPVIATAPDAPTAPVPSDSDTTINPAYLVKLDWADCVGATSYDVYLWLASATKPETATTNVSVSEYSLSSQVLSLENYKWQIVAKNTVGNTAGPEWTFSTIDRRDISGSLTLILDAVVGAGPANLVGNATTFWASTTSVANVILNGNMFTINSGGGNPQTYNGAMSGPGTLRFQGRSDATWEPDMRLGGSGANSPTAVILDYGRVQLNKTAGVDALAGTITVSATSGNAVRLQWLASDQIHDAATIDSSGAGGGFYLVLGGFSDTLASLTLKAGHQVDTGAGGVLTVSSLTVGGEAKGPGTYTEADGFVAGTGSVVVAAAGTPYELWAETNAGGQSASEDYDGDGMPNGVEFFMGATGSSFTANPTVVAGKVSWPHVGNAAFEVQVSDDLVAWTPADPEDVDTTTDPAVVTYTLPTGAAKKFCRLVVTP